MMVWVAAAAAAALIFFLYLLFPALRRHPDRAVLRGALIAHRGLHDRRQEIPENSLPAFEAAIAHGYIIETDLRLTSDGQVILFHDDTLQRLCGIPQRPEELTLKQLRALRIDGSAYKIPTLGELLELAAGRVPLLLELKSKNPATCAPLCRAVDGMLSGYRGKYLIQSFYPPALFWYRRHRPEICRGQLSTGRFRPHVFGAGLLSCLLCNFISRPDFINYDFRTRRHFCRRLCVWLGALGVGWTFRSQAELAHFGPEFSAYVFEGFLPRLPADENEKKPDAGFCRPRPKR